MSDSAEVKILPPVVLTAAIGLEIGIAVVAPVRVIPGPIAIGIGTAVIAVSVALAVLAARQILRADTAFDARKPTTAIVTTGVYRFTRNPVYLSMILLIGGIALLLNSPWALLLMYPTGTALCLTAIRPEERYLERKFGGAYRSYCNEVPRWLSSRRLVAALASGPEA
jgi:protein-S-isoprenylcysteine O-methyltransferase Ste14